MVFYTDVFHINAATVGGLFLIARVLDAIADLAWGRFIDTRKTTKNGKFKPWIFRMSFPLVISGVLMFVQIPGMSDGFYLVHGLLLLTSCGELYIVQSTFLMGRWHPLLQRTWIKGLVRNKPLIWILIGYLLFMMNTMLIGAVNVYLFKDYFSNTAALRLVGLLQTVAVFIAIPLVKPLVARFGKKEVAAVGMVIASAVYLLLYFMPNISASTFVWISAVGMFGYGFFNIVIWAFIIAVIDYHEFLTGLQEDGTVYSIYSFARNETFPCF